MRRDGLERCLGSLTRPADVAAAEFWAGVFTGLARSAREWRAPALAERADATAKGFTFRAEELRYDARGGMTEELERRRFEPGARWSVNGIELAVDRLNIFGLPLVHFRDVGRPVERAEMTRANGWLFLDLGDVAGGHVPPGGWP